MGGKGAGDDNVLIADRSVVLIHIVTKVLGHTQRSDFTRPKATLSLTSAKPKAKSAQSTNGPDDGIKNIWALEGDETNYDDEGDDNMPGTSFCRVIKKNILNQFL
jgi:hypothetical protein